MTLESQERTADPQKEEVSLNHWTPSEEDLEETKASFAECMKFVESVKSTRHISEELLQTRVNL